MTIMFRNTNDNYVQKCSGIQRCGNLLIFANMYGDLLKFTEIKHFHVISPNFTIFPLGFKAKISCVQTITFYVIFISIFISISIFTYILILFRFAFICIFTFISLSIFTLSRFPFAFLLSF